MQARLGSQAIELSSGCRYRTKTVVLTDTKTGEVTRKVLHDVVPQLPKFAELGRDRPRRGEIKRLSIKSRRRLKFTMANFTPKFMVTLTYPDIRSIRECYRNLNTFLVWLRSIGIQKYVWVAEMQERGALHFHLVLEDEKPVQKLWDKLSVFLDEATTVTRPRIAFVWSRITGTGLDGVKSSTRIERLRTEKGGRSYIGKYLQKGSSAKWTGRRWGSSRTYFKTVKEKTLVRVLYRVLNRKSRFTLVGKSEADFNRLVSIINQWERNEDQLSTRPPLSGNRCVCRKEMGLHLANVRG